MINERDLALLLAYLLGIGTPFFLIGVLDLAGC
jgi:cytochrome c biogenesis protein CcdA